MNYLIIDIDLRQFLAAEEVTRIFFNQIAVKAELPYLQVAAALDLLSRLLT